MSSATFSSFDGVDLAVHRLGAGQPVLMLHGYLGSSRTIWLETGIADAVAQTGFEAVMLDHRAHGESDKPDDIRAYPTDVLARDAEALIARLRLRDFAMVGYSLGGRTAVRLLARGVRPTRCIVGGMGDNGVVDPTARIALLADLVENGELSARPEAGKFIAGMIATGGLKVPPLLHVLKSQPGTAPEVLAKVETPVLVLNGIDDHDNGSALGLASMMSNARAQLVPGNHVTAVRAPELKQAIVAFLTATSASRS